MTRVIFGICCLLFVAGAAGCNRSDHPEQFAVSGKVTLDLQPLTKGTVEFFPDSSKGTTGPIAFGSIGPDGTYQLKTFARADGAKSGFYKVGIQCYDEVPFNPDAPVSSPGKSLIPIKYADAATSGLTAEVKAGRNEPISFDLSSR